jgi:prepilin-type N-terminal cleavage/methylation domain-containing protein
MGEMMNRAHKPRSEQSGFTLLEMVMVVFILTIMMGVVFQQVNLVQRRSRTEQSKLDAFQQARDFVDVIVRDIHGAGYPNARIQDPSQVTTGINSTNNAIGLVKVAAGELRLETFSTQGTVIAVVYQLSSGTLSRSQAPKVAGSPLTAQTVALETGVERVQNTDVFTAYKGDGTVVTLPVDISTTSGAQAIASIRSIEIRLQVQGAVSDLQTKTYPVTTLRSMARVTNCSEATTGQPNSC